MIDKKKIITHTLTIVLYTLLVVYFRSIPRVRGLIWKKKKNPNNSVLVYMHSNFIGLAWFVCGTARYGRGQRGGPVCRAIHILGQVHQQMVYFVQDVYSTRDRPEPCGTGMALHALARFDSLPETAAHDQCSAPRNPRSWDRRQSIQQPTLQMSPSKVAAFRQRILRGQLHNGYAQSNNVDQVSRSKLRLYNTNTTENISEDTFCVW